VPGSEAARGRILLVEDDPAVRGVLVFLLESGGWEVSVASDGRVGLALARGEHPDVVVTDLRLPVSSGIELAARLGDVAEIPIVAITSDTERLRDRALRSGYFTAVLTKPFDPGDLLRAVGEAIGDDHGS
jgi:CheY-like chemotaxis protein